MANFSELEKAFINKYKRKVFAGVSAEEKIYKQRLENLQKRANQSKYVNMKQELQALHQQLFGR